MLFGLVRNLRLPEFPASDDAPESPLAVTLVERHFLRACEDRVAAFAGGLGARAAVTVHASLDDVLMKLFAGKWVTGVLKQLGMRDDEAIESAMVARRIRKAQDGFIPLVVEDEVLSDSPEEWFQSNRKA